MAETQAIIVLQTTGGDQAASEINKATKAVGGLTSNSEGMQKQFQHKFQHLGLMLFASDALRAAGLGNHVRDVIGIMNTTISASTGAFAKIGGPILLAVTALTALAGIVIKVSSAQASLNKELQQAIETNQKLLTPTSELISSLDKLHAAGGRLTDSQKMLLSTSQNLSAELRNSQIELIKRAVVELETNRQKIIDHANTMIFWHKLVGEAKAVWNEFAKAVMDAFGPLVATVREWFNFSKGLKMSTEDTQALNLELAKNAQLLAQKKMDLESLRAGYNVTGNAAIEAQIKEAQGRKKVEEEMSKTINEQHALRRKNMDTLIEREVKAHQEAAKKTEQFYRQMAGTIGSSIGGAFARSIVEGKDFANEMQKAFKDMAMQIISDIIRIEVEWAILTAMGFPGAGGGLGGFGGFFPTGGSRVVDRPTMFVAGDAGPEQVSFTPLAGGGGTSGAVGGGAMNVSVQVTANGVSDPNELARKIGPAIIQEIRGMGQLNFVRR